MLFMTVLLVTMLPLSEGDLSYAEKTQIRKGLDVGKAIAKFISSGDFKETMRTIGTSVGKYLGVLGPFMGLVLSFVPASDSAELNYMKDMMKDIDTRFDRLDSRFDEIGRKIDWIGEEVTFSQLEMNILTMALEYELVYEVSSEHTADQKAHFVRRYDNDYDSSGSKLYQACVGSFIFSENLGKAVMSKTNNDRKETNIYLLGTMQLLLQAAKIEIAYLKARDSSTEHLTSVWEQRILEVKNKFDEVDRDVALMYKDQSGIDIDDYAAEKSDLSNEDFSAGLYDILSGKFYWKDWFVVIYNPIWGWDKHTVSTQDGHIKFRQNGRNIVVSCTDKSSPILDLNAARTSLEACNNNPRCSLFPYPDFKCVSDHISYYDRCYDDVEAKHIFRDIQKPVGEKGMGVIKLGSDVWYRYDDDHRVFISTIRTTESGGKFELYMWG